MRNSGGKDPWSGIVRHLLPPIAVTTTTTLVPPTPAARDIRVDFRGRGRANETRIHDENRAARIVNVLDRLSDQTVTISWRDATMCHYDDQIWRLGVARRKGHCALTGESVGVGEPIYRPIPITPPPLNAQEMILASALAETICHSDDALHEIQREHSCRRRT